MSLPEPREAEVPVLTQVVLEDEPAAPAAASVDAAPPAASDAAALDALSLQLERELLERLGPEIHRVTARALDKVRAGLTISVLQIVHEAVAASVAKALNTPRRD